MKEKFFGIDIVFDHKEVDKIIEEYINNKTPGYVVSLSFNNVAVAFKNDYHREVVNGSIVSFSDSVLLPILVNLLFCIAVLVIDYFDNT